MDFQQDNNENNNGQSSEPVSTVVIIQQPSATNSGFGAAQTNGQQGNDNRPASSPSQQSGSGASPSQTGNSGNNNQQDDRQGENDNSGSSGLSGDEKKAVIATTTICGTLILLLLIYVIFRKRKGATYGEIFTFRPQSQVVTIGPYPDDSRLTALPIYRHNRFSIRSSRHPSRANLLKQPKMAAVPSNLRTAENRPGTPLVDPEYTTAPTTPTQKGEWKSFLHDASPPQQKSVERPQEAHVADRDSLLALPVMRHPSERRSPSKTYRKPKNNPGLTLNLEAGGNSPSPSGDRGDRWSWTNSQAPSTPRIAAPNRRSSLTSARIRNVASWVRNQGRASEEPKLTTKEKGSKPLLKNQAVRPVLAPHQRKGSKSSAKHKRVGSLSSIFKPNSPSPSVVGPGPLSPRLEEQTVEGFEMETHAR